MYRKLEQSYRRITVRLRSPNADLLGHHPNQGVPKDVFREFAECFSKYQASNERIEVMLPRGHPDLNSVLDLAQSLALNIEPHRATKSQVEILDYSKCPESEILSAKYIECDLISPVFDDCIDFGTYGNIFARLGKLEKSSYQPFGTLTNFPHLIFVRGVTKCKLESAGLAGLRLTSVPIDGIDGKWPPGIEPLYFISSSVHFPLVDMKVFDDQGNVLPSSECDWSCNKRWYPLDGYEVQPLLKYQSPLPDVDVALSEEHFGGFGEGYRRIIYSQKAKTLLEDIGMKLECVPVRIDAVESFESEGK